MTLRAIPTLCLCAALLWPLQRWLDAQPKPVVTADEEAPYRQTGRSLRSLQLGFHSLLADVYWLRAIQYVGGKIQTAPANVPMREWGLDALAPMLNVVTELDPNFIAAYRFGAAFLPETAPQDAVGFVERGINANPNVWQLYLDLGYLHWQRKDYAKSREAYERGSRVAGAPKWLLELAASTALKGGDRETARLLYQRLYESSTDEYSRSMVLLKLQALAAEQ
jgi:tetratricopeptide (TPR) repeat protein